MWITKTDGNDESVNIVYSVSWTDMKKMDIFCLHEEVKFTSTKKRYFCTLRLS